MSNVDESPQSNEQVNPREGIFDSFPEIPTSEVKVSPTSSGAYVAPKAGGLSFLSKFLVPESLALEELLMRAGEHWWLPVKRIQKLYFIISLIEFSYAEGRTKRNGWVQIPSAILRAKVGKKPVGGTMQACYVAALEVLERVGVIDINHRYSNGRTRKSNGFSKSFRLGRAFWNERTKSVSFGEKAFRAVRDNSRIEHPVQEFIRTNLRRLQIDERKLCSLLSGTDFTDAERIRIENNVAAFRGGNFSVRGGTKQKRVTHALTHCKSELRSAFTLDGEELCELDIPCCQPLLLLALCHGLPAREVSNYKEIIGGDIYTSLTAHGDRERAKREFGKFAFGPYKRTNEFGRNFIKWFPSLAERIRGFDGSLCAYLQNLEAEICIYDVVQRCMQEGIFIVPIHDGFLMQAESVRKVNGFVRQALTRRLGFAVDLKAKNCPAKLALGRFGKSFPVEVF